MLQVVKKERTGKMVPMGDISVPSTGCYYAQGVLTHNSKDPVFSEAFEKGEDIHKTVAVRMFGEENYDNDKRKKAKIANFGLIYDGTAWTIKNSSDLPLEECQNIYDTFWTTMTVLKQWKRRSVSRCYQRNGTTYTAFGRPRRLKWYLSHPEPRMRKFGERSVTSHQVQGCLQGHVKILTNKGYIPIVVLYNVQKYYNLKGFKVWTGTKWASFDVLNRGKARLSTLKLKGGHTLDCDVRHEVLCHTKPKKGYGVSFRKVTSFSNRGIAVCRMKPIEIDYPNPLPDTWTFKKATNNGKDFRIDSSLYEELWYWVGRWVGDGCWAANSKKLQLWFGRHEEEAADRFVEFVRRWNPNTRKTFKENEIGGQSIRVEVCLYGLIRFLQDEIGLLPGTNSKTKRAPVILFSSPLTHREAFIRGLFEADGYGKGSSIHLMNWDLLRDVKLLCEISGIETRLNFDESSGSSVLRMRGKGYEGFKTSFSPKSHHPDYDYGSFDSLEILDKEEETYTLSVHDESHQFVSEGIISKNTAADIMRIVLVNAFKEIFSTPQDNIRFIGCVHDELDVAIRKKALTESILKLKEIMEILIPGTRFRLKVDAEIGSSYGYNFPFEQQDGVWVPSRA